MPLTAKQKQYLRKLAHPLKPIVFIGNAGLNDAVLNELESSLAHHELIKIKLPSGNRLQRQQLIAEICRQSHGEIVQAIGRVAIIYRSSEKNKISLPYPAKK